MPDPVTIVRDGLSPLAHAQRAKEMAAYMKTDQPFFRRVFVVGVVGATIVYGILLLMFSSTVLKA